MADGALGLECSRVGVFMREVAGYASRGVFQASVHVTYANKRGKGPESGRGR